VPPSCGQPSLPDPQAVHKPLVCFWYAVLFLPSLLCPLGVEFLNNGRVIDENNVHQNGNSELEPSQVKAGNSDRLHSKLE